MARTAMAKRKKRSNFIAYLSLASVVALVGFLFMIQTRDPQSKLDNYKAQEQELDKMIQVENARTEDLLLFEKEVQTDAYAEEQAQEKLKLLKENQIMFIAE
ncbi:MAG: septum formation initiator family protein [Lachnospiraceae bacterium]|nr:septum formation initiator family protein [Lachnospiraceae bacterium]